MTRLIRPLSLVAVGIVFVAVDFRARFDLLPDPAGWALVAFGATRLDLKRVRLLAALAAVLSLADVVLGYGYATVDVATGLEVEACRGELGCTEHLRYLQVGALRSLALAAAAVIGSVALSMLLHALQTRVGDLTRYGKERRRLGVLKLAVPIVVAAPVVAGVLTSLTRDSGYDPVWNGAAAWVAFVGVATLLATATAIAAFSASIGTTARPAGRDHRWL